MLSIPLKLTSSQWGQSLTKNENKVIKRNQAPSSLVQKQTTTLKGINIKYKDTEKKSSKGEDGHPEEAYTMRKGRILLWAKEQRGSTTPRESQNSKLQKYT